MKNILVIITAVIIPFSISAQPYGGKITYEVDHNAYNYDYTIYFECYKNKKINQSECKKFQLVTEFHDARPTIRSTKILDLEQTSIEDIYEKLRESEKRGLEESLSDNYKSITYSTTEFFGDMDNGEELNLITDAVGTIILPFSLLADLIKSPGVFLFNQIVKVIPGDSRLKKRDLEHLLDNNTNETKIIEPNEASSSSYFYYNFIQ